MKLYSLLFFTIIIFSMSITGCKAAENTTPTAEPGLSPLSLPPISAVSLDGRPLKVVATTSIIGDIARRVGGGAIDLTVLMAPGQDPHSYEPSSGDLTAAAEADVIFVNGWNLEEGLVANLETVSESGLLVPVSAGITPLAYGHHDYEQEYEHDRETAGSETPDPHVWLDPHLVVRWVDNIALVLASLDPDNAELYRQNAADYHTELQQLIQLYDEQLAAIPAEKRVMITNHDSFGYFAAAYDFEVIGTILPGAGALAEPSAGALAELIETMEKAGVCTIFAETTANVDLAETVAAELAHCENMAVIPLYTGALGPRGSGADTYTTMMAANLAAIMAGLV